MSLLRWDVYRRRVGSASSVLDNMTNLPRNYAQVERNDGVESRKLDMTYVFFHTPFDICPLISFFFIDLDT